MDASGKPTEAVALGVPVPDEWSMSTYIPFLRSQFMSPLDCKNCSKELNKRTFWEKTDVVTAEALAASSEKSPSVPFLSCPHCQHCTCVACGIALPEEDIRPHAPSCKLRFHYASAVLVEGLRQAQLRVASAFKPKKPAKKGKSKMPHSGVPRGVKHAMFPAPSPTEYGGLWEEHEEAAPKAPVVKKAPSVVAGVEWCCPTCTFINQEGTTMCGVCETAYKAEYAAYTVPEAVATEPWACEVCTFVNEVNQSACALCEAPRVIVPAAPAPAEAAPQPAAPQPATPQPASTVVTPPAPADVTSQKPPAIPPSVLSTLMAPDDKSNSFVPTLPLVSPVIEADVDAEEEDAEWSRVSSDESEVFTDPETAVADNKPKKNATLPPHLAMLYSDYPSMDEEDDYEGYGYQHSAPGNKGGVGYAGSQHDMHTVKYAALRRQKRENRVDGLVSTLIRALIEVLDAASNATPVLSSPSLFVHILLGVGFADGLYIKTGSAVSACKSAKYRIGKGDGVFGPCSLYDAISDKLRMTMMDIQAGTAKQREVWFALVQLLFRISKFPECALLPVLTYAPTRDCNNADTTPTSFHTFDKAAYCHYAADDKTVHVSRSSIVGLLSSLTNKAALYAKAAAGIGKSAAPGIGALGNDDVFVSLLSLAQDVQTAASDASAAVIRWVAGGVVDVNTIKLSTESDHKTSTTTAKATPAPASKPATTSSKTAAGAGAIDEPAGEGEDDGGDELDDDESFEDDVDEEEEEEEDYHPRRRGRLVKYKPSLAPEKIDSVLTGVGKVWCSDYLGKDPSQHTSGHTPTEHKSGAKAAVYSVPGEVERKYVEVLKEEAYNSVEGLEEGHALVSGPHADRSKGGRTGFTDPKRLMRVSAEMANLPDLAVHWGSSILVRTDEASMDIMRAYIVGPPDTPYANGWFGFDIQLTPAYPDEPPKVEFITTGGGRVRFNPNLYAEGKVCLSLLGTWQGPGWEKGVSTLSQVLLSIQAQILVDKPYANEPGYERRMNSSSGKRAVAMHNTQLRLATIRHAMLEVLRKQPKGFERAVNTHFWLKRDEIKSQIKAWLNEAKSMAEFESKLIVRWRAALAAWKAAQEAEKMAIYELRHWMNDTSISAHQVFGHNRETIKSGASTIGLPQELAEMTDEFDLNDAGLVDKREAGIQAQRKLYKSAIDTTLGGVEFSGVAFRPLAPTYSHGAARKSDTFGPVDAAKVWKYVNSGANKNIMPPLTGAKARELFYTVMSRAGFTAAVMECQVRTETVEMPEYAPGDFLAVCEKLRDSLVVPHKYSECLSTRPAQEGNPFPIAIDANMLTSEVGVDFTLQSVLAVFKQFQKKSLKDVFALVAAVPDRAMFVIRNIIHNHNQTTSSAGAGVVLPTPATISNVYMPGYGNVTTYGAGSEILSPTTSATSPAGSSTSPAAAAELNPPVLTYGFSSMGRWPNYYLSGEQALALVESQEAGQMYGMPYGHGYSAMPASSSVPSDVDAWTNATQAGDKVLKQIKKRVTFSDLARAMEYAVTDLEIALDAMTEPVDEELAFDD